MFVCIIPYPQFLLPANLRHLLISNFWMDVISGCPLKAKPMIWDYFEMLPNSSQHGKCKTCKMNVSCKFNTGNFVRHLQLTHKDVYRQYQSKMENAWNRTNLEHSIKQI